MVQWLPEARWPTAIKGQVFILAAFDRVGRAMFGSEWTGREGWAEMPVPQFMPLDGFGVEGRRLGKAIRELRDDRVNWHVLQSKAKAGASISNTDHGRTWWPTRSKNLKRQRRREMPQAKFDRFVDRLGRIAAARSQADWDIHVAHLSTQHNWAGTAAAIDRRSKVRKALTSAAANGEAQTYARFVVGGAGRFPVAVEAWDIDDEATMNERFGGGTAVLSDPAGQEAVCYLFFDRDDLDRICRGGNDIALAEGSLAAIEPELPNGGKRIEPASRMSATPARWTEPQMSAAILQWTASASPRDRDRAWREHFKALSEEHGWDNRSFRDHWPVALNSVGKPGRSPNPALANPRT